MTERAKTISYAAFMWAITGISLIFISAILRLLPRAQAAFEVSPSFTQWLFVLGLCAFMLYTEGYMGFQKQFSPRAASRALLLINKRPRIDSLLAPLFCMGYFHATKKRLAITWLLTFGIILLVVAVRLLPQPWRGFIDFGVIAGLTYGLITIYYFFIQALITGKSEVDPEIR